MKKVVGHVATTVNTANAGSMAAGVAAVADAVSVSLATANCVW